MTTPERLRRRQLIESALIILIGIIMIVQQQSWHNTQEAQDARDAKQDAKQLALVTTNTALTECLAQLTVQITSTTAVRSQAVEERDEALVASMQALIEVMRQRVIRQQADSAMIQRDAQRFINKATAYIERQQALNEARNDYPTPEFKDFCPRVAGTDVTKAEEKANNEKPKDSK